jgi:hypothetical protein
LGPGFQDPGAFTPISGIAHLFLSGHKEIVEALKIRDGIHAEELVGKHKNNLFRALKNYFKQNPKESGGEKLMSHIAFCKHRGTLMIDRS